MTLSTLSSMFNTGPEGDLTPESTTVIPMETLTILAYIALGYTGMRIIAGICRLIACKRV